MSAIDPIRRLFRIRRRTGAEPSATGKTGLPALIEGTGPQTHAPSPPDEPDAAAFAAQLLGQDGRKRGLRGGAPVLDQARSSYLQAEYSGPADRRPPQGRIADTAI